MGRVGFDCGVFSEYFKEKSTHDITVFNRALSQPELPSHNLLKSFIIILLLWKYPEKYGLMTNF